MRINSNILALSSLRSLSRTTRALARAMQRLSSGQRINSAGDDAAGLAIATGLESQRRGMLQAIRNMNEARGFLDTADGALATQSDLIQRMRELALQSANGTLSSVERRYLNTEAQELMSEFNRITSHTEFNGARLLDGSFTTRNLQVGTQKTQEISFNLFSMKQEEVFFTEITDTDSGGSGTFESLQSVSMAVASALQGVTTADLNEDGNLDLIAVGTSNAYINIRLGNGNGTFQATTTIGVGTNPYSIVATDINSDGNVDLFSGDSGSHTISILLGNGNGTFQTRTTIVAGLGNRLLMNDDVNNDGFMDLLSVDYNEAGASVYLGNGNGTFQTRLTQAIGGSPYGLDTGDFNGDGKVDLISGSAGGAWFGISLGNGNGTFAALTQLGGGPYPVLVADLNNDGKLDVLGAESTNDRLRIFLGNGNGTFATSTIIGVGDNPRSILALDLNSDGKLDLVSGDQSDSTLSVMFGNGNGSFQTRTTLATGSQPSFLTTADLNEDGAADLIACDFGDSNISILYGNSTRTITTSSISLLTQSDAQDALLVLDTGMANINLARANIGATQSRLDFAENNALNTVENISSSRSQILDADMAVETAEFTRQQVLQQAGIAVLGQANLSTKLALQLLEQIGGRG